MSIARNPDNVNAKLFATTPTIALPLQTDAYNWTKAKASIKFRTVNGKKHYFVSSSGQPKLKEVDIDLYLRQRETLNWRTFATFQKYQNRLWFVIMS
jgi:hypothetical protein